MELRHFEHFLALAEELSFTRASKRLNIVQSGLSGSIRALEAEVGAALFVRNTRRVELTEPGQAFLVEARRVLSDVQTARNAVTAVKGLLRGTLTVGIMQRFASSVDLPAILGRFSKKHTGVQIRLIQAGSTPLMEGVREGRLDLAILAQVGRVPEGVSTTLLERVPLVLILPRFHSLAQRKEIPLASLGEETFVDFQFDWGMRALADRAFAAVNVYRRIACEVNDVPTLLDLVAHGLGIALVPKSMVRYAAQVRCVAPRPPVPTWDVAVARSVAHPAHAAAQAFFTALVESAKKSARR
jgi:DNA-binding transcriptional LysR family regulator